MKFIQRFIALKMSILRVDAAIIKRKKVKPNVCPKAKNGALTPIIYIFYSKNSCKTAI